MTSRTAFRSLVALALLLLGMASALLGYLGIPNGHMAVAAAADACAHVVQQLIVDGGHAATPSETTLTLVLTSMVLAALGAAAHTAWLTRSTVGRLSSRQLPLTPSLTRLTKELELLGRVTLCDSPELFSYCVGMIKPVIHISVGMVDALDEDALLAVLAHERHHLLNRDPLRAGLASVLAAAAYPLPLASALRRAHILAREIEADQAATVVAGKKALAKALLTVIRHPRTLSLSPVAAIGAFDPQACRVAYLTQPESTALPRPTRRSVHASVVSLMMLAILAGFAINHPAQARDMSPSVGVSQSSMVECSMDVEECEFAECESSNMGHRIARAECDPAPEARAHHDDMSHGD